MADPSPVVGNAGHKTRTTDVTYHTPRLSTQYFGAQMDPRLGGRDTGADYTPYIRNETRKGGHIHLRCILSLDPS